MRRYLGAWGAWVALLLTTPMLLATPAIAGMDAAPDRIEKILQTPGFEVGHWGVLVVDRRSGEVVFEQEADRLFIPAEVGQLFAAAAALETFGVDHRFQTPVYRRGEVGPDGTLQGDLILVAVGDPSLGGRTSSRDGSLLYRDVDHTRAGKTQGATLVEADPLAGLDHLAREVKSTGILAITGEVIVDDRLFLETPIEGATPSKVSPIAVNDNLIDVLVTPAAEQGAPADVRTVPESRFFVSEAQVDTVAEGEPLRVEIRGEGPRRFSVRGQVPVGHPPVVRVHQVDRPADFARAVLIEQLRARGVRVDASPLGDNPAHRLPPIAEVGSLPRVAQYTSPPLREYVRVILKVGHHSQAAMLPLLLASFDGKRTLADGLRRQGVIHQKLGLPVGGIILSGGGGTHRTDLVSPRAVVELLRAMEGRPGAQAFEAALPVIGREGTALEIVAAESPVRGHGRAHSGTAWMTDAASGKQILLSKSLAGYLETSSGRRLVFAIFVNNVPTSGDSEGRGVTGMSASRLLGTLCETFYHDQPAAPRSAASGGPSSGPASDSTPTERTEIPADQSAGKD